MVKKYKVANREKLPVLRERYDERSKYDWITIRTQYIEGTEDENGTVVYPGPKDLIAKFEIPEQALRNRITKERWVDHRTAHQTQVAVERQKEQAKFLAKKAVKFDEQAASGASSAQELILRRLNEALEVQQWDQERIGYLKYQLENGMIEFDETVRKQFRPLIPASELESLGKAFALFNEVGRKALGIKDDMPAAQANMNIQINQVNTSASDELSLSAEDRNKKILEFLGNPNVRIPGLTDTKALEADAAPVEDILEAEVVDDEE